LRRVYYQVRQGDKGAKVSKDFLTLGNTLDKWSSFVEARGSGFSNQVFTLVRSSGVRGAFGGIATK
jgi:hypothetical protein